MLFGERFLAPILRDFLAAYPAVTASALFVDRNVNLLEEGLDLALRIGELPDSSLLARRVGSVRPVMVASPDYLHRHGKPETPEALHSHRIIFSTSVADAPVWHFSRAGKRSNLRVAPALRVNVLQAAIDAAEASWGITRALSYQVADALAARRLVEILADCEDREFPVHLLHAEGRRVAAKTRSFIDFTAERLRGEKARLLAR